MTTCKACHANDATVEGYCVPCWKDRVPPPNVSRRHTGSVAWRTKSGASTPWRDWRLHSPEVETKEDRLRRGKHMKALRSWGAKA